MNVEWKASVNSVWKTPEKSLESQRHCRSLPGVLCASSSSSQTGIVSLSESREVFRRTFEGLTAYARTMEAVSTTLDLFQTTEDAISENNVGAASVQNRSWIEAIRHFATAARLLLRVASNNNTGHVFEGDHEIFDDAEGIASDNRAIDDSSKQTTYPSKRITEQKAGRMTFARDPCDSSLPADDSALRYGRPFLLLSKDSAKQARVLDHCSSESAAVLYNLALAHHLGMLIMLSRPVTKDARNDSENLVSGAIMLYEMAYNLALKLSMQHRIERAEDMAIVMASLNNLGILFHSLEDNRKAKFYFDLLCVHASSIDDESVVASGWSEEQQDFLLNATVVSTPRGASAA